MTRLRQIFENRSDKPLIIFLELSTSRYRLEPGGELHLFYDDDATAGGPGTPITIEYFPDGQDQQIIVYTDEDSMFLPDGTEAQTDYTWCNNRI